MRSLGVRRFRDAKGHTLDPCGWLYLPHALMSASIRAGLGYRERKPWLSFRAIKCLNLLVQPDCKLLEFGSGTSTAWFSRRCGELVSIEDNPVWFSVVEKALQSQGTCNVDLRLREKDAVHILDDFSDGYFDFALIDGVNRAACMHTALRKVRNRGYVYLDNSDQYANNPEGDTRIAENTLLSHLEKCGTKPRYFVDFSPGSFFVSEGLLAQI